MEKKLIKNCTIFKIFISLLMIGFTSLACNSEDESKDNDGPDKLPNTSWKFYGFGSKNGSKIREAMPIECETCYTITFHEEKKITGKTTTNDFVGEYTINGDELCLKNVGTTKVGEIGDGEEFYLSLLSCSYFSIIGKRLFLYYNNKQNYLLFNLKQKPL